MSDIRESCTVCGSTFSVIFRYQMEEKDGAFVFFCTQRCLEHNQASTDGDDDGVTCDACAKRFKVSLVSQIFYTPGGKRRAACSTPCRAQLQREAQGMRLGEIAAQAASSVEEPLAGPTDAPRRRRDETMWVDPAADAPTDERHGADRRADARAHDAPVEASADAEPDRAAASDVAEARREAARDTTDAASHAVSVQPSTIAQATSRVFAVASEPPHDAAANAASAAVAGATKGPRRIAVFNHKGGTGKTTTSVNLAAGLADRGARVLLVDTDSQGNVAVSLWARAERSLYHVLVMGLRVSDAVQTLRPGLDLLPANETLAAAELYLAGRQNRDRVLAQRIAPIADEYDYVIVDCSPSLSLMNQNALVLAEGVLVPVACDYLSLVGVRQVIKTVKNVNTLLRHPLQIWGVLPTFYDARARICREALETLRSHFGERCLAPVRATTKLKEAPAQARSIFEHAPGTHGAEDYAVLVDALMNGTHAADAKVLHSA